MKLNTFEKNSFTLISFATSKTEKIRVENYRKNSENIYTRLGIEVRFLSPQKEGIIIVQTNVYENNKDKYRDYGRNEEVLLFLNFAETYVSPFRFDLAGRS